MWRAVSSPPVHTALYIGIIAWESVTMLLCWWAGVRLLKSYRADRTQFAAGTRQKDLAVRRTKQWNRITKTGRPLTSEHFAEFGKCFGADPNGRAKRKPTDSKEDRWRKFSIDEVKGRDFKIDSLKWLPG